jgi:aldehyde dehydrogenase (NAD+)
MKNARMVIGAILEAGKEQFDSINPYTGEAWATVPAATASDVDAAVAAAREAYEHLAPHVRC